MDISQGFQIESPQIFVSWGITENQLKTLFENHVLHHVTKGYYTTSCISLEGLIHELGFHFEPRVGGGLVELEFFRKSYPNLEHSYQEFQQHFELLFGQPTKTQPGSEGFPIQQWWLKDVSIIHCIFDRFGPEEHMKIRKSPTVV